jgi:hypothetical protein
MNATELNATQLEMLEKMREKFAGVDGFGMDMDDHTFLRYLRAR